MVVFIDAIATLNNEHGVMSLTIKYIRCIGCSYRLMQSERG